jgi:hypothetical protein
MFRVRNCLRKIGAAFWCVLAALIVHISEARAEDWCETYSDYLVYGGNESGKSCSQTAARFCGVRTVNALESVQYFSEWRMDEKWDLPDCLLYNSVGMSDEYQFLFFFSLADKIKSVEGSELPDVMESVRHDFLNYIQKASSQWMSRERYLEYIVYYTAFVDHEWSLKELRDVKNAFRHPIYIESYCFIQNDIPWNDVLSVKSSGDYLNCLKDYDHEQ